MARDFGSATSGCLRAVSRGGPPPRKAVPSAWPPTNWRCCSRPATRCRRARPPTGAPWDRWPDAALQLLLPADANLAPLVSIARGEAGFREAAVNLVLSAGCRRMPNVPEIVEVDNTQLEEVLHR